jgi:acetyl esterase/lipase
MTIIFDVFFVTDLDTFLFSYIAVNGTLTDSGTHIFYWFFEARNNPKTAPLVLWLTGNGFAHLDPPLS